MYFMLQFSACPVIKWIYVLNAMGLGSGVSSVDLENLLGNHRFGQGSSGRSGQGGGVVGGGLGAQPTEAGKTSDRWH